MDLVQYYCLDTRAKQFRKAAVGVRAHFNQPKRTNKQTNKQTSLGENSGRWSKKAQYNQSWRSLNTEDCSFTATAKFTGQILFNFSTPCI
jgi:hypothetical protein